MSKFPHLPLFTDAFIADTSDLNATETGAYLMLLMCAWRSPGCRLPNDDARLARMSRVDPKRWARYRDRVMAYWRLDADGYWVNNRLSREHEYVTRQLETKRANGALGGRPQGASGTKTGPSVGPKTVPTEGPKLSPKNGPNPLENNEPGKATGSVSVNLNETYEKAPIPRKKENTYIVDNTPTVVGGSADADATAATAPGRTRLPSDWRPSEAGLEAARRLGFPEDDLEPLVAEFVDHWTGVAGAAGRKANWHMTWVNRLKDVAARRRLRPLPTLTNGAHHGPGPHADRRQPATGADAYAAALSRCLAGGPAAGSGVHGPGATGGLDADPGPARGPRLLRLAVG